MLEARSGFRFATETLEMCFCSPVAQADHLQGHCAVKAFLARAVNYTLTAPTDFLQQLVIAKVGEHLCAIRFLSYLRKWLAWRAGVIDPGYRIVREQIQVSAQATGVVNLPERRGREFSA